MRDSKHDHLYHQDHRFPEIFKVLKEVAMRAIQFAFKTNTATWVNREFMGPLLSISVFINAHLPKTPRVALRAYNVNDACSIRFRQLFDENNTLDTSFLDHDRLYCNMPLYDAIADKFLNKPRRDVGTGISSPYPL